jgi:hypothetical protein
MYPGAQLAAIAFALVLLLLVFEMVRRRYLAEGYAVLWLGAAVVLVVLAVWSQLLTTISKAVGVATPSNAFFVIAFAFLLLLVLHLSAVVSRLADETRVLAQRIALLERRDQVHADTDVEEDEIEVDERAWMTPASAAHERRRSGSER